MKINLTFQDKNVCGSMCVCMCLKQGKARYASSGRDKMWDVLSH